MVLLEQVIPCMQLVILSTFHSFDACHDQVLIVVGQERRRLLGLHFEGLAEGDKDQLKRALNFLSTLLHVQVEQVDSLLHSSLLQWLNDWWWRWLLFALGKLALVRFGLSRYLVVFFDLDVIETARLIKPVFLLSLYKLSLTIDLQ